MPTEIIADCVVCLDVGTFRVNSPLACRVTKIKCKKDLLFFTKCLLLFSRLVFTVVFCFSRNIGTDFFIFLKFSFTISLRFCFTFCLL